MRPHITQHIWSAARATISYAFVTYPSLILELLLDKVNYRCLFGFVVASDWFVWEGIAIAE
jgi:hypothetical protein